MSFAYQPLLVAVGQSGAVSFAADAGSALAAGQAAAITMSRRFAVDAGAVVAAGQGAGIARGRSLAADTGDIGVAGEACFVMRELRLQASGRNGFVSGQPISPKFARRFSADTGQISITAPDIALQRRRTYTLVVVAGSVAAQGQSGGIAAARRLLALTGSIVIDGKPAVLTRDMPGGGTPPTGAPLTAMVGISVGL
jgi:hypothetical protein